MIDKLCIDCIYQNNDDPMQECLQCRQKNNWQSKSCSSCKYINTDMEAEPCAACKNYGNWKPEKESGEPERNMREYEAHIRQSQRDIDNFVADLKQARESHAEQDDVNHPNHYTQGGIECKEARMLGMTRKEILQTAEKCVCGDREQDYGSPEDNFSTIAKLWEPYLSRKCVSHGGDVCVNGEDVAALLALVKIGRIASGNAKVDNWIDLAGYAACGGEIESQRGR